MYEPQNNLLEGIKHAFPHQLFPWDEYFARMAETDWLCERTEVHAVKSFFVRHAPFGGSYAILGGITAALREIDELRFDNPDFQKGMLDLDYHPDFVRWLASKRHLRVQVLSAYEGSVFFPNEPIITVIGPLPDIRLAEGIITGEVNFPILSLTKWHRLALAAHPGWLIEFARRRAQHATKATLYGMLAGCVSTSHTEIRRFFNVKIVGTQGHEWVQSFGDVSASFDAWLEHQPRRSIGLVDTKQCLEHDFPAWLNTVYKHREAIKKVSPPIWGWRNDSGDLAELTVKQFEIFYKHPLSQDPWFVDHARVFLTNNLDEYAIDTIKRQIENHEIVKRIIWAAGTKPGNCYDQPAIDGVAKLMEVDHQACIKLAFDAFGRPGLKTSIPGSNRSVLMMDEDGIIAGVALYPERMYCIRDGRLCWRANGKRVGKLVMRQPDNPGVRLNAEKYRLVPQQHNLFDTYYNNQGFTARWDNPTINDVVSRTHNGVATLPRSMTRFDKPSVMGIWLTPDLYEMRVKMIEQGVLREDFLE